MSIDLVRPGICPPNDIIGICQVTKDNCLSDTECDINEKCCSRGCGRQCVPGKLNLSQYNKMP